MKRYLALALFTATVAACDGVTSHTNVVARAGHHELTVDEAVDMIAAEPRLPARDEVVRQIAELWVDYHILATIVAEDSTLANLNMEPLLRPYVEQRTYAQIRDQVVTSDTVINDDELAQIYAVQAPGVRLKARHILLSVPSDATPEQEDSIRALAEDIRQRAETGEDFSALARQYSDDQGSAQQGGDLGWFGRGRMVQPFEDAAFAMDVGQVSDVVETPFGLHIIKLDDREVPALEDVADSVREAVKNERRQASLDAYVDSLKNGLDFDVQNGAGDVIRELAQDPSEALTGRAGSRELLSWQGGAVTARDVAELFRDMAPQQRAQFANVASDEQLSQMLEDVATNKLVLADAETRGITVPQEEQDSIAGLIKDRVLQLAQNAGLTGAIPAGETEDAVVERRVNAYMNAILTGQANVMGLGSLSNALRQQMDWRINQPAVERTVRALQAREDSAGSMGGAPAGQAPPPAQRPPTGPPAGGTPGADTTG